MSTEKCHDFILVIIYLEDCREISMGFLSGITIAVTIHSDDRLF